jgi:hypothetical protein
VRQRRGWRGPGVKEERFHMLVYRSTSSSWGMKQVDAGQNVRAKMYDVTDINALSYILP